MLWNKKGALELSITAIVVLIIAITVLGLAIFFIKNLFWESTELLTGQLAQIKDQLRTNMQETGELLVFSKGTELKVKRGERFSFHIGARNTAPDDKCFRIAIVCNKPFTTGETCADGLNDIVVGGVDDAGDTPTTANWFPQLLSEFTVPGGDIAVSPATLQVAAARPDTYLMQLKVFQGDAADCTAVNTWSPQTKRFHIILS
jgi:hypothetical protein